MKSALVHEYFFSQVDRVEQSIYDEVSAIRTKSLILFRLERLRALLLEKEVLMRIYGDLKAIGALR